MALRAREEERQQHQTEGDSTSAPEGMRTGSLVCCLAKRTPGLQGNQFIIKIMQILLFLSDLQCHTKRQRQTKFVQGGCRQLEIVQIQT